MAASAAAAAIATAITAADVPLQLSIDTTVRLRRGADMPLFGLGTWLSEGDGTCQKAVEVAIKHGYRLIDTATMYGNEQDVGAALRAFDGAAKKTFVVSKLKPDDHGRERTLAAIDLTLAKLGVETLDLWLMHSPSGKDVVENDAQSSSDFLNRVDRVRRAACG